MMKNIKDPIYGYLEIEDKYFKLIDTAYFQRLRNIRQTSYQALYPSALHNRFVHSLGVFHLGKKAIIHFRENIKNQIENQISDESWSLIEETFILACLLHDVGHSPFSHIGEARYLIGTDLKELLCEAIYGNACSSDLLPGIGSPHEAMSVLIGLEMCDEYDFGIDRELFARAIIGLRYTPQKDTADTVIRNAIITLLNGRLIDVDKLDYLSRDSYVTGYSSLTIDVDRLLSGYTIGKDSSGQLRIAYERKSLSVVENVIYANDLERRWIQNHPTVLYDSMLMDFAIRHFDKGMMNLHCMNSEALPTVFVKQALSATGLFNKGVPIRLLCDDDIVSYIKNVENPTEVDRQLISRDARLKPLWKSEAEFDAYSSGELTNTISKDLQEDIRGTLVFIEAHTDCFINETALTAAKNAILEAEKERIDEKIPLSYKRAMYICELFNRFQTEYALPDFEFAVVMVSIFETNYRKLEIENINIEVSENKIVELDKLLSVRAQQDNSEKPSSLFYVYTTEQNLQIAHDNGVNLGKEFFECFRMWYQRERSPMP